MNWGKLTPDEVWARLDAIFRPRQESGLAQLEFRQYKQMANKPVLTYIMTKCALSLEVWPDQAHHDIKVLNLEIIKGLKCVTIKCDLMKQAFNSAKQLKEQIMTLVSGQREGDHHGYLYGRPGHQHQANLQLLVG